MVEEATQIPPVILNLYLLDLQDLNFSCINNKVKKQCNNHLYIQRLSY